MLPAADEHITLVEQMSTTKTWRGGLRRHERQVHVTARHLRFQLRHIQIAQRHPNPGRPRPELNNERLDHRRACR